MARKSNSVKIALFKLGHRDYEVRMRAVERLGVLLTENSAPRELIGMLEDNDDLVRVAAAETLGRIGDREALPDLWKAINDSSSLVRSYVAQAIGMLGDAADAEKLVKRLKHERDTHSKMGIYEALYRLGDDRYLLKLIALLKSRDYRIRCAVANALPTLLDDRSLAQFILSILRGVMSKEPTIAAKSSMSSAIMCIDRYIKTRASESKRKGI